MDKRSKKRIEVLQKKRSNLRTQLSVVHKFPDNPDDIPKLEQQIAAIEAELAKLKGG